MAISYPKQLRHVNRVSSTTSSSICRDTFSRLREKEGGREGGGRGGERGEGGGERESYYEVCV